MLVNDEEKKHYIVTRAFDNSAYYTTITEEKFTEIMSLASTELTGRPVYDAGATLITEDPENRATITEAYKRGGIWYRIPKGFRNMAITYADA